jgi:microcompartment protein CcmL/EutN
MALVVDESDPCAAAAQLRQLYYQLVAGQGAMIVTFKAGVTGVERSVTYNKADPGRLLTVIRGFEERCAAASGAGARRFAIRGGGL